MTSGSEEFVLEDSDESLLDIKEINDLEFDIPEVSPPSLEKVLWDMESEEGSDTTSLQSFQSMTSRFKSMLLHCVLKGVSTQLASASDRVKAGIPTVITNSVNYVGVGTSQSYILTFDSEQNLCWCHHDANLTDQGAISALAFNLESTRLLVGYERGLITMLDAKNGEMIRKLSDAHAPQTAVLHLRFTFLSNIALCGDSSGCVFSINFHRRLGVRSWDSKCLFSGARGEVCVFEPLLQGHDISFLNKHILVAMATLSKVIVISIRPHLRVHFSQQLPRISTSLPLISWQLVLIGKHFQPVLGWARGSYLHYTRLITNFRSNSIHLIPLRNVQLPYTMTALHWLGPKHLALLDTYENLHLVDVKTQRELELLELSDAGIVYGSAHFKALAVGGGVSEAFALAGQTACYNSLSSRGTQLLVLGTKSVHLIKLRTWPERLSYLSDQGRWSEALTLAAEDGLDRDAIALNLMMKYLNYLKHHNVDKDSLTAAINCCVKLNKIDILCNGLLEAVSTDQYNLEWYYTLLTDHISNKALRTLLPTVSQMLVEYLEEKDPQLLETVVLALDIGCLDLHQVLKACKRLKLYNAWIHITTKTLRDYTIPLTEFLAELKPDNNRLLNKNEDDRPTGRLINSIERVATALELGNTMLVYVSSCLAGLGYPTGNIPKSDISRVKCDVLRCLETIHSINNKADEGSYPYLRALLKYNTRECLNVVELAFTEAEFSGEMGSLQKQRLISILLRIVVPPEFSASQIINLACFTSRLIINGSFIMDDSMWNSLIKSLTDLTSEPLSIRDHSEREQAWIDLLQAQRLKGYKSQEMLELALKSNCYRVAEYLYEIDGDYNNIFECYLNDHLRKKEVFNYIENFIEIPKRCIKQQFLIHFKTLLMINCEKVVEIVIEHFPNVIENFYELIESDGDLKYKFLHELVSNDVRLPNGLSEVYLEELCIRNKADVCKFVMLCMCRIEESLEITRRHGAYEAEALLLEQSGEWLESLNVLITNDLIDEAVALCIRGAEHIDPEGAQRLWLTLLQSRKDVKNMSLRQLLQAAISHVPPDQLLDLVSNVHYGEIKQILQDMLKDYKRDIELLQTSLNILDTDLHSILAKILQANSKCISVRNLTCSLCQKSFSYRKELETNSSVCVWSCGHSFHAHCMQTSESNDMCPICRMKAKPFPKMKKIIEKSQKRLKHGSLRPDLEGHF